MAWNKRKGLPNEYEGEATRGNSGNSTSYAGKQETFKSKKDLHIIKWIMNDDIG